MPSSRSLPCCPPPRPAGPWPPTLAVSVGDALARLRQRCGQEGNRNR